MGGEKKKQQSSDGKKRKKAPHHWHTLPSSSLPLLKLLLSIDRSANGDTIIGASCDEQEFFHPANQPIPFNT